MSRILLVRHGQTNDGHLKLHGRAAGVRLSAAGHIQASRLARHLQSVHFAAVYSSPLERCMQTATSVLEDRYASLHVHEDLQELNWGAWSGMYFRDLASDPQWKEFHNQREISEPPNGESLAHVQARVVRILNRIAGQHEGKVLVVTHGDLIKAALFFAMGLSLNEIHQCEINAASMSEVEWTPGYCRVLSMNVIAPGR